MTLIATMIFLLGIVGLFLLNREPEVHTSKALWLPTIWLMISGSRPVSLWFYSQVTREAQYLEGSPFDRNIYVVIIVLGIIVLLHRQSAVVAFLRTNPVIALFLLYCVVSIFWSDFPSVAFKRWIKCLGDYAMILIVLTEPNQLAAIKRVLSRAAFVLLPFSVLFIKYYPDLGRVYARFWEGTVYFRGVAEDKNMLGMTCLIFGLSSAWRFLQELSRESEARNKGVLRAHGAILLVTFWLLWKCNSMTSLICLTFGIIIIGATTFLKAGRRRIFVHLMVFSIASFSFCILFLQLGGSLLSTVGRDPTLTGRTDLWALLFQMVVDPIRGAGFESFWLGGRLEKLANTFWWHPNESHNGYIEMYLNLGWIGLTFLAAIIVTGYRKIILALSNDPEMGRLRLAYFVIGIIYNFTEAAIRTMAPVWLTLMLAVITVPMSPAVETEEAVDQKGKAPRAVPEFHRAASQHRHAPAANRLRVKGMTGN